MTDTTHLDNAVLDFINGVRLPVMKKTPVQTGGVLTHVTKHDGRVEEFEPNKLNKWAEYAVKSGGDWSMISLETVKRVNNYCTTQEIHQTMINVCLMQEELKYSRVAARLECASIRKNMDRFGISDRGAFKTIFDFYVDNNIWSQDVLPEFNPVWEEWYADLYKIKLEFWQLKQWTDKYRLTHKSECIETPHVGILGIALALHGDTQRAYDFARAVLEGKINLPTPALNGCRNGDFDSISCCLINGGDTAPSIGVAEHIAYMMTAKKAGIGVTMTTRSKGDGVKGGRVTHLGKHGIFTAINSAVKMFTQISRGGSATVTYNVIDPEIEEMLLWKTQRVDIEQRIDKIDYSLAYNEAFLEAVIKDQEWYLYSLADAPELYEYFFTAPDADSYNKAVRKYILGGGKVKQTKARTILKSFLTGRQDTSRIYSINVTRANKHTPFFDTIYMSNLCQEIMLPNRPYLDMFDLYAKEKSVGETAFCSLAAINVYKVGVTEYEKIAELALRTVDRMIDLAPMMTPAMKVDIVSRRSIGIGITGLAGHLYKQGMDYDGSEKSLNSVRRLAERHYFWLLKASQKMAREEGVCVEGVNLNWLPCDTKLTKAEPTMDWESLRGKPRKHSVLVAHMPTESSAVFSDAPNGLYPVRNRVIYKKCRLGAIQYIAPEGNYKLAWDIDNITLAKYYGAVQDWTDQGISADYYVDYSRFPKGKVPMSQLMKEWIAQAKYGVKSQYYLNSNDYTGGSFQDVMASEVEEEGCVSCKL